MTKLGAKLVRHLEDMEQEVAMERIKQSLGIDEQEGDGQEWQ